MTKAARSGRTRDPKVPNNAVRSAEFEFGFVLPLGEAVLLVRVE